MTDYQFRQMMAVLSEIRNETKAVREYLRQVTQEPGRIWDEDAKEWRRNPQFRTFSVDVDGVVEVTGSVTTYEPR
jgi:hypothetical protein